MLIKSFSIAFLLVLKTGPEKTYNFQSEYPGQDDLSDEEMERKYKEEMRLVCNIDIQ